MNIVSNDSRKMFSRVSKEKRIKNTTYNFMYISLTTQNELSSLKTTTDKNEN